MKIWHFFALGIFFMITYFLFPVLFWLAILIICIWLFFKLYRFIERVMAPPGKRIKHGLLKGHLEQEYGTREGKKLYQELVSNLRKKGYR